MSLRKLLLIPSLLRDKCVMHFDKCFLFIYGNDLFFCLLYSVNVVTVIDFWVLNQPCILGLDPSRIVMVYYSCYILLESVNHFIKDFDSVFMKVLVDKFLFLSCQVLRSGMVISKQEDTPPFSILCKNFCKMSVISSVTAWYYNRIHQWNHLNLQFSVMASFWQLHLSYLINKGLLVFSA